MALDSYHFAEAEGVEYRPGNPVIFAFHGTGGDENQFIELAGNLYPEAIVIAPRGDVSESGALCFFRRTGEGIYDMEDLARRIKAMGAFAAANVERLRPSSVTGIGYSNGANILASVMLDRANLFSHAALMHPLIPWTIEPASDMETIRILITAGGRDPICPAEMTGQLIDGLEGRGATVKSVWHPGGHEIVQTEIEALTAFFSEARAQGVDAGGLAIEREEQDRKGRYVLRGPGDVVAEMTYHFPKPGTMIIDHTEVPDTFRGLGVGMRLLETLVGDACREGTKIIPICPFAAAKFAEHPEWDDLLEMRVRTGRG